MVPAYLDTSCKKGWKSKIDLDQGLEQVLKSLKINFNKSYSIMKKIFIILWGNPTPNYLFYPNT